MEKYERNIKKKSLQSRACLVEGLEHTMLMTPKNPKDLGFVGLFGVNEYSIEAIKKQEYVMAFCTVSPPFSGDSVDLGKYTEN